ncbi:MAG: cobalamin B12-binding domain-containing protein [Thermoflexales bacterium]|nr:cobalamin B12-binding domain-containing protein [Thermoflexales bacterium]
MAEERMPVFNLKAVVRETGVAAPTLRTWERRYGLPRPQRAPSGRRLYSRRDIETVRWLARRVAEGMTVGQAVALWRSLEEAGKDPLVEPPHSLPERPPAEQEALERWRDAWVAACLAFDEAAADAAFGQALAAFPPEVVCTEVLREGLAQIGEAWYRGDATVHQEHFASHLAARRVQALLAAAPLSARPETVLVVCPPGEQHAFGALLLTYLLRRAGWRVVYLGADLPVAEAEAAVRRAAPRWVIASAYHLPPVVGIQALGRLLREMGVPLAFGGRVFNQVPALRSRIAGYFLGERMEDTPARLAEWAVSPLPLPIVTPEDEAIRRTRDAFLGREWEVRARVLSLLSVHPATANLPDWLAEYTFSHIRSALMLGDIALADAHVDWLRGLRDGFSLPLGWVAPFLEAYRKGVERYLGDDGAPLLEWLEEMTE